MSSGREPTAIGRVRHVLGATVTVELDADLAGVTPIWRGHLMPIGQVGSLVRIPQGPVSLLGSVTLVGIAELTAPPAPSLTPQQGDRWLQVQLLGEVDALGVFRRGISTYPGLDDSVHFATSDDLVAAYPPGGEHRLVVGALASSPDVPVSLGVAPLVTRHSAILGSTGSGKTSAVSSLLQALVAGGWNSANVLIIDPHGEYASALGASAAVRTVLGVGAQALRVPYWALPASELLSVLCDVETRTVVDKFSELVLQRRREFAAAADWLDLTDEEITADTPIPFDLCSVWYDLDFANRAIVNPKVNGTVCLVAEGDPAELMPAVFEPYGAGGAAPFQGPTYRFFSPAAERLRLRLKDPKFQFFLDVPDPLQPDPLIETVANWLGGAAPVSVLDFSGVPSDVADVAIGVILQMIFELSTRSTPADGVGRGRPVLVVLEEAHRYLSEGRSTGLARGAVNRIAREGRKYGMGLCLVSQRPSELPDTALSQCGTIIALRLTNSADQTTVRTALPDAVAGLASVLPSLRTGEALISGEAIVLPTRAALRKPDPEPRAADPTLDGWRQTPSGSPEIEVVVGRWRGAEEEPEEEA
jgi:uncharacterized protein